MSKIVKSPKSHTECLTLYKEMSYSECRIVDYFASLHEAQVSGDLQEIFPSIERIAKKSGCSERTVNNTIKKFEGILFSHERRKQTSSKKNTSNKYFINRDFFEFIWLLKRFNWLALWKKRRKKLSQKQVKFRAKIEWQIYEFSFGCEQEFLIDKMNNSCTNWMQKLRTEFLPKLRSNRIHINKIRSEDEIVRENRAGRLPMNKEKEASEVQYDLEEFKNLGLMRKDQEALKKTFASFAYQRAKDDLIFLARYKKIHNPAAFMWARSKKHTIDKFLNKGKTCKT